MFIHPDFDPVALDLGIIKIHWYGIMYLVGFAGTSFLLTRRTKNKRFGFNAEQVSDIIFYGALGVVLGGRIGYILFYNFSTFLNDPLVIFEIYKGGMSFHGGVLGVTIALFIYGRKIDKTLVEIMDFVLPAVPIGLLAGRFANFVNAELYGRITDVPWGMVFPQAGPEPRHASMLYEMILEGFILFIILWWYSSKPRPKMVISGMFLAFYGSFRFAVEFVRQPDAHMGFMAFDWMTQGQILSVPMILFGIALIYMGKKRIKFFLA
jgi:phosphatidylglycerol:prolipoprotein diacylglycerol transferase